MGLDQFRYMEFSFDQGRVDRSRDIVILPIDIEGEKLPDNHYMAVGGSGEHHYCHTKPHFDCDCHDFSWGNDRLCKHLIAALVHEEDGLIVAIMEGGGKPIEPCNITLVCGPPGSGKTTYVEKHADPGHFIWDMDKVAKATVWKKDHATAGTQRILRAMRDAALGELDRIARGGTELEAAWIVWTLPKSAHRDRLAKRYGARVIVLERTVDVCVDQAIAGGRDAAQVEQLERAAHRWWDDYEQREGDERI